MLSKSQLPDQAGTNFPNIFYTKLLTSSSSIILQLKVVCLNCFIFVIRSIYYEGNRWDGDFLCIFR